MMARALRAPETLYQLIRKRASLDENSPNRVATLLYIKQQILKIKKKNPDFIGAYLAYARILRDLKDNQAALREYEHLENHPKDEFRYHWKTYLCHGICLSEQLHYTESIAVFEKIIHFNKKEVNFTFWPTARQKAEAYNALAIVYGEQGKFDLEYSHFSHAVIIDPSYAPAWSGLGKHYSTSTEEGAHKKSFECFETARKLNPSRYNRLHPRPLSKATHPDYNKIRLDADLEFQETAALETLQQKWDGDLNSLLDFPPLPPARVRSQTDPLNKASTQGKKQPSMQLANIFNSVSKQSIKISAPQTVGAEPAKALLKPAAAPHSKTQRRYPTSAKRPPRLYRAHTAPEIKTPSPLPAAASTKQKDKIAKPELRPSSTVQTLQLLKVPEPQVKPASAPVETPLYSPPVQQLKPRRKKKQPHVSPKLQTIKIEPVLAPIEDDNSEEKSKPGCWEKTKNSVGQLGGTIASTALRCVSLFSISLLKPRPSNESLNNKIAAPSKGP